MMTHNLTKLDNHHLATARAQPRLVQKRQAENQPVRHERSTPSARRSLVYRRSARQPRDQGRVRVRGSLSLVALRTAAGYGPGGYSEFVDAATTASTNSKM